MTLAAPDEQLHAVPAGAEHWQENLFFICWSPAIETGLLCHVQRVPDLGVQAVQVAVAVGGAFASATIEAPFDARALIPELTFEVVRPFHEWRLRLDAKGTAGRGPLGFFGVRDGGDVPFGFDVTLESALPVVDFAAGLADIVAGMRGNSSFPQMGDQQHYEQGGTWAGRLSVGTRDAEARGLFVRDHSWGARHEQRGFKAFWTASCLDEGRVFCNAIGIPTGGRALGIGAVATPDGVTFTSHVAAYFGPAPGIGAYNRTSVSYGPPLNQVLSATTGVHVPITLPHSGPRRYDNNAISTVRMGTATGFGVMEWAAVLSDAEAGALEGQLEPSR
ncbi:MAG: hypothetical protein JO054_18705 [Actinobacteria bacterium]|nr:hypothetical protein [Actinomycetota bacterium]MBV9256271.1 hypothetical protein [Actinomycetota bacterium]